MQAVKHGGLSGKARRVRERNRAARLYARQLLENYLEPEGVDPGEARYIPIRGRKDFLPSIVQTGPVETSDRDPQLHLPLDAPGRTTPARKPEGPADGVIRFPRTDKRSMAPLFKPPEDFRRKPEFTWRGFLVGCAMGSAAAAFFLLIVQTVVS